MKPVPREDVGWSYPVGVIGLEVMVAEKAPETAFVYATGDCTTARDVSNPFITVENAVVMLAVDVIDGDDESAWIVLFDKLNALELVVCDDCDVVSTLLRVFKLR